MNAVITSICFLFAFSIPSIGTESPLRECNGSLQARQAIVDTEELALYQRYGKGHLVCDHVGSEISGAVWDMALVSVGDIGILYTESGASYYECTAIVKAKRGRYAYNYRGKPYLPNKNDIVCVSCVDETGDWVYAAYFDYCFTDTS